MRHVAAIMAMMILVGMSGVSSADPYVQVQSPTIPNFQTQPYGSGFDGGVIIGPNDGCRNYNCPRTDLQNRPSYRRYYDNYFDVPVPTYSGQRRIRGNPALNPSLSGTCAARYRSYRASDNTYQPFQGPRQQCISP